MKGGWFNKVNNPMEDWYELSKVENFKLKLIVGVACIATALVIWICQ